MKDGHGSKGGNDVEDKHRSAEVVLAPPRVRRRPVVGTIVFGLVMLTISAVSLLGLLTDITPDVGLVGLGLLIGAGLAMVAGGLASVFREARDTRPDHVTTRS